MNEYWKKRNSELLKIHAQKADDIERELIKEYERSLNGIKKEIETFYARYAGENGISMAEARKQLSRDELKGFKLSLEEFREKALDNADGKWTTMLDNEYMRSRVSRLEALKYQMRGEVELLKQKQEDKFSTSLKKAYSDTYYTTNKHIADSVDYAVNFAKFDRDTVKNAIYEKWLDGSNFSDRIWNDKQKLLRELNTNLVQGITRGDSPDKMIKNISSRMNVSKSRVAALYQTEYTHIMVDARLRSIMDAGCDEYEIDENMDSDICDECASMHGKHFKLSEYQQGITAPPFHTRCRGTITAYFAEDEKQDDDAETQQDDIDYMSKAFGGDRNPKIGTEVKQAEISMNNGTTEKIKLNPITNSQFEMFVDDTNIANKKAIKLAERSLSIIQKTIDGKVEMPKVAIVDFDLNNFEPTAIAGYDKRTDIMYINGKYMTVKDIIKYVNEQMGMFANKTEFAPYLHEIGHKYFENCVISIAKKHNLSYNQSINLIKSKTSECLKSYLESNPNCIEKQISEYASLKYGKGKIQELYAECFSIVGNDNELKNLLINVIKSLM